MPPMIAMPPTASNAAAYDRTHRSGNTARSFIAKIRELLTAQKGATKGRKSPRSAYGARQAATVAGGSPSPDSFSPGMGGGAQTQ